VGEQVAVQLVGAEAGGVRGKADAAPCLAADPKRLPCQAESAHSRQPRSDDFEVAKSSKSSFSNFGP